MTGLLSLDSTSASLQWGEGVDDSAMMEMDKLTVEETKDLLISTLFVLKHLDTREFCGPHTYIRRLVHDIFSFLV